MKLKKLSMGPSQDERTCFRDSESILFEILDLWPSESKWASPKMQEIIKQAGPSRQLFETINFTFMKIFDLLIKTALFRAFLLFLGDLCH